MRWLWSTMAGCYAHLWTSGYGAEYDSDTGKLWAKALGNCTGKQLQRGVDAATANDKPHPPTLPQFRAWCLQGDKGPEAEESSEDRHSRLLARDRSDLEYFRRENEAWAKTHNGEELFDIGNCFNSAQRADLGIPASRNRKPTPAEVIAATETLVRGMR